MLKGIEKGMLGIECGPWKSPLVPKDEGYKSLVLDVFSKDELVSRATSDPNIPKSEISHIEDVDLLGSSMDIGDLVTARGLVGSVDYIISSHNFEHIPNPVRFLQGCEKALKDRGVLVMAIPDKRYCFDHFRALTSTSEVLEAFLRNHRIPTPRQIYDHHSLYCSLKVDGLSRDWFSSADDLTKLEPSRNLKAAYASLDAMLRVEQSTYHDVHCWTFTPESFALLILELNYLGLISLALDEFTETVGCEFFVRLSRGAAPHQEAFFDRREALLRRLY